VRHRELGEKRNLYAELKGGEEIGSLKKTSTAYKGGKPFGTTKRPDSETRRSGGGLKISK